MLDHRELGTESSTSENLRTASDTQEMAWPANALPPQVAEICYLRIFASWSVLQL